MPHSKHRKKSLKTSQERRLRNRAERSAVRTAVKKARTAAEKDPSHADASIAAAASAVDKAAKRNTIHHKRASRIKSRLAKAQNRAAAAAK